MSEVSTERATLGYRLGAEEGEAFWVLGMLETLKVSRDDTSGQFGLIEVVVRAGDGSPWHIHPHEDEWFYTLDGEFTFYVGDARMSLPAGSFAFGPRGVPHTFIAEPPDGGKALIGFQPFLFEGFMREAGEPAPNAFCRHRSTVRRTWSGSSPSRRNTGWISSGRQARLPGDSATGRASGAEVYG